MTLLSPDAPIIQLFKANDTHPPTRCALGFQITDVATAAEALAPVAGLLQDRITARNLRALSTSLIGGSCRSAVLRSGA